MLSKYQIAKIWDIARNEYNNNDDDGRKMNEVIADFAIDVVNSETKSLQTALNDTNQLMSVLLSDPLVQKDQKDFIRKRLEINKSILQREGGVEHAKS